MKKIMTLILAAALCLTALVGCGDNAGTDSNNYDSKTYKVAVVQQLDHSSLNEIRDAIEAELDAAPEGVTVTYENFNGQNDSTVLNQIGSQIVSGGYDAPSVRWPPSAWRTLPTATSPSSMPRSPTLRRPV